MKERTRCIIIVIVIVVDAVPKEYCKVKTRGDKERSCTTRTSQIRLTVTLKGDKGWQGVPDAWSDDRKSSVAHHLSAALWQHRQCRR